MARSSDVEDNISDVARSPRQPRTKRTTLAGLDLDPEEEDEEYNEDFDESVVKDEEELEDEEDAEPEDADEDEDAVPEIPKKKRGRKRKVPLEDPEDSDENEALRKRRQGLEAESELAAEGHAATEKDGENADGEKGKPGPKKGKKRGRKPKIPRPEDAIFDDKGNEINVKNDEVVLEEDDPAGNAKVDEDGFLQGDRKYRIRTFTLLGKGQRQYMVSTEPARLVGFRDSYLLFKTHHSLFKKVCTHDEKMDLINRQLIPTSYKGRAVNLVTARSIFREFGARMVVGGKKITDDYWEQKARDRGDVEGEYADPEEVAVKPPNYNAADHSAYSAQAPGSALINYQTDHTWMYQVASQTVEYNKALTQARDQAWTRGVKDTYSGFNFYPTASQPQKATIVKTARSENDRSVDCTIRFYNGDIRKTVTGLAAVPSDVFDDIEDEEIKAAILAQQAHERAVAL